MKYPKNKYRKGYTMFGLSELMSHLDAGRWVYLRDKVVHPGFILNMTLMTVRGFMNAHLFSEAINQKVEFYRQEYQRPYPPGVTTGGM